MQFHYTTFLDICQALFNITGPAPCVEETSMPGMSALFRVRQLQRLS